MIGWLGDFFRFWWALFYWNSRKAWFRLRGAHRDSCPCQSFSDSGLALDSRCEAVSQWHRPHRFRKVCPALVETADGWRCSVDAERVRPYWLRAITYGTTAALVLYLLAAAGVFAALRLAGYEISYLTVASPVHWPEIRRAQEKLYANQAQQAMNAGRYNEAILALDRVCQLNPLNYQAGLALANLTLVASHPSVSDTTYERLMQDVPDERIATARIWFHTLLARGAYDKLKPLATTMLLEDVNERSVWLNALLFSARVTQDSESLNTMLNHRNALTDWCVELLEIERDLLSGHLAEALPRLTTIQRQPANAYVPYYQVDRLIRHRQTEAALTVLNDYAPHLPRDEAGFLRLRIYRTAGWTSMLPAENEARLGTHLNPLIAAHFCAYLLAYPDRALCSRYGARFNRDFPAVTPETLPLFQATYLAAAVAGDKKMAEAVAGQIRGFTHSDARVLAGLGELLSASGPDPRLARILPLVPLPIEVVYAILERKQAATAP